MAVPTLDYSRFVAGTSMERKKFAHDLLSSFERTGFAKVTNHTFSVAQLQELFKWVSIPWKDTPISVPLLDF